MDEPESCTSLSKEVASRLQKGLCVGLARGYRPFLGRAALEVAKFRYLFAGLKGAVADDRDLPVGQRPERKASKGSAGR